ncbi:MAG: hypothetical protein LBC92_05250, partial [Rickettsiales bacterium]|nr:hypothetical protein [Rickettsiales bacterium]
MKEKRVNRIIKNIPTYFFNGKREDKISIVKTMKVGIEFNENDKKLREKLDILMEDADLKRREVLKDLMNEFYKNPNQFIEKAGKIKKSKKTEEELKEYKFNSQKLYKTLYTGYAKGNSYKNYSSMFYESVLFNVAKEVCSFLDKYYTVMGEIEKTIEENDVNLIAIKKKISVQSLPKEVSKKTENDNYNKTVKQNNILINLYNQKQEIKDNKLILFKILKGFPSFPLVEKKD